MQKSYLVLVFSLISLSFVIKCFDCSSVSTEFGKPITVTKNLKDSDSKPSLLSNLDRSVPLIHEFNFKNLKSQDVRLLSAINSLPGSGRNGRYLSIFNSTHLYYCIDCLHLDKSDSCNNKRSKDSGSPSPPKFLADPCCLDLCLRKHPNSFRKPFLIRDNGLVDIATGIFQGKVYEVLDWVNIQGRNTSVCLCFQNELKNVKFPKPDSTNPEAKPNKEPESEYKDALPIEVLSNFKPNRHYDYDYYEPLIPEPQCQAKCKSVDKFGMAWEECPGIHQPRPCPRDGWGYSSWYCLQNGSFEGSAPNFENCTSNWLGHLERDVKMQPRISFLNADRILDETWKQINDPANRNRAYFGHESDAIVNLTAKVIRTNETNLMKVEDLTIKMVNIYDSLLAQSESWDKVEGSRRATHLITTLEGNVINLSKISVWNTTTRGIQPNENYEKVFSESQTFMVTTGALDKSAKVTKTEFLGSNLHDLKVSDTDADDASFLSLPIGWESQIPGNHILYAAIKIKLKNVKNLFPEKLKVQSQTKPVDAKDEEVSIINGPILSLSVSDLRDKILPIYFQAGKGVRITILHDTPASVGHSNTEIRRRFYPNEKPKAVSESAVCVYWDTSNLAWSTNGCKLIESHTTYTICECEHLTAFAVLMDMHNYIEKDAALITLTYILCIFSVFCLVISIVIFLTVRSSRGPRTSITIQLCVCLLIGNILVLTVMDRNNFNLSSGFCAAFAMITHYVFLCAFAWMAIEGYVVYKMLIDVFETGTENKRLLHGIAYGVPFLIVLIFSIVHAASNENVYGGEMYCWLVGGYIWSFIGPVFLVVTGNIFVMIIALSKVYQLNHSTLQAKKLAKSYRTWIVGSLSLTSLLGITWVFGALLLVNHSVVANIAAYIFTTFNASQGIFIFIFHCWMNDKVRNALLRKFRPETSSMATNIQTRRERDKEAVGFKLSAPTTASTNLEAAAVISEEERFQITKRSKLAKSNSSEASKNSRKPAFLKYLGTNKKNEDQAFM